MRTNRANRAQNWGRPPSGTATRPQLWEPPLGSVSTMSRYRCDSCDYVYDEKDGDPREGFPPGTAWSEVPDDWACPDCGVREKIDFVEA